MALLFALAQSSQGPSTGMIVAIVLLLVLSLSCHEAAHAWVAYLRGDSTAKDMGRMTLNPLVHIDPFMSILLPTVLMLTTGMIFGGAKPVPVNPYNLKHPLRDMVWVALAGPISNLLLAILLAFIFKGLIVSGLYSEDKLMPQILLYGVYFNLLLAVFNMLPIPPLDGSRVLTWLLPAKLRPGYVAMERYGLLIIFGLLMLGPLRVILWDGIGVLYELVNWIVDLGGLW